MLQIPVKGKKLQCKVTVKKDSIQPEQSAQPAPTADSSQEKTALIPEIMKKTKVEQNPYLSSEESMIHNDIYNSDVTEKAMPLGPQRNRKSVSHISHHDREEAAGISPEP